MELTNIFEAATRYKYRFPFKGMISVEDLWDLKLQDLDSVFKLLNKEKNRVMKKVCYRLNLKQTRRWKINSDCEIRCTGKTGRSCRETCCER